MSQVQSQASIDFHSDRYRQPFSRINGIVIEGEQEAYDNFLCLAQLLPEHQDELTRLGRMEFRHRKSFEACGRNLSVIPDLDFAEAFFADLRQLFQEAVNAQKNCKLFINSVVSD